MKHMFTHKGIIRNKISYKHDREAYFRGTKYHWVTSCGMKFRKKDGFQLNDPYYFKVQYLDLVSVVRLSEPKEL